MNSIKYYLAITDHFITTLANNVNEELGNNRYEVPSAISNFYQELQSEEYDISTLKSIEEYLTTFLKFKKILETKLPHCNHENFYQRIKTLTIEEHILDDDLGSSGDYEPIKNKFKIYRINEMTISELEHIFFHELLHLATTYQYKDIVMCGFSQCTVQKSYFEGLNEGYTEILNLRYFSKKEKKEGRYQINQLLVLGIEDIIGKEKMETLYFDANLDGLIDELCNYATIDEIYTILKNMDIIKNLTVDHYEDEKSIIFAVELSLKTSTIIANIKQRYNKRLYEKGEMTQEEYEFESLKTAFYSGGTVLQKTETGYIISHPAMNDLFVSKDAYRIIKEHFFNSEQSKKEYTEDGYDVELAPSSNGSNRHIVFAYDIDTISGYGITVLEIEEDEHLDLSGIKTIELTKEDKKVKRKIIPIKEDDSTSNSDSNQNNNHNVYLKK